MKDITLSLVALLVFLCGFLLLFFFPDLGGDGPKRDVITGTLARVSEGKGYTFLEIEKDEVVQVVLEGTTLGLRKGERVEIAGEQDGAYFRPFTVEVVR